MDGVLAKAGCSTQGYNLYTYCSSNPINLTDDNGSWPTWGQVFTAAIIVAGAVVIGAAVIASAGAAGMAVGVLATSLGASGAVASAAATVGSVGTVVAGSTIIACGASDAVECVTGTNLIRDGLMNGNQDAYDLVNMGAYIAGGMALEAGQMYPKAPAKKETSAYASPKGGGGVTATVKINGKTINFGHGGRHLTGTGLDMDTVNRTLANEVSKLNLVKGQFYKGKVVVEGVVIEYTSYGVSDDVINIGTYYLEQK